jgi:NADP-dependent 3-hydroxy acid dehydrogenase YdfG
VVGANVRAASAARPSTSASRRFTIAPLLPRIAAATLPHCLAVAAATIMRANQEDPEMAQSQKVALVTGAGTGIGKAVALALMQEGYATVLAGRRQDKLEETANAGKATGAKSLVMPTDVSAPAVPLEDLPLETWRKVVDTNLTGMFLCTQEAIKIMKDQTPRGGRIINNGSISAHTPRPRSAAYTATKHAVSGLTKSTSLDCRAYDITCSQIDIGNAATPLTERMVQGQGVMQADGRMAIEPRMDADDVGKAVVYIANLPLNTNVLFMTVMANLMPFVGRG